MKRLLLLAVLLAACGGPSRTVMVNGREVSVDDAANEALRRAKQAQDAGRNDEANCLRLISPCRIRDN